MQWYFEIHTLKDKLSFKLHIILFVHTIALPLCGIPPDIANGNIFYSMHARKLTAKYICIEGFKLTQSDEIKCTDEGNSVWIGTVPQCGKL